MRRSIPIIAAAVAIGVVATGALETASHLAYESGSDRLAHTLSWANTLLQNLVPCINIGTVWRPLCEGSPLNVLAYFASFPLSIAAYSVLAYAVIRSKLRRVT